MYLIFFMRLVLICYCFMSLVLIFAHTKKIHCQRMIFHALTPAGTQGRCWNHSLKGQGFNPKGPSWCKCIRKEDCYYCTKNVWLERFDYNVSKSFLYTEWRESSHYLQMFRKCWFHGKHKSNKIMFTKV